MNKCQHDRIKLRLEPGKVIGIQESEGEQLELVNCPTCGTTIGRPTEDARHLEDLDFSHGIFCGVPPQGSLIVENVKDVTCPLCMTKWEKLIRTSAS